MGAARPSRRWIPATPWPIRLEAFLSSSQLQRLKLYLEQHERRIAAISFAFGFVFDIVTTGRIDSWALAVQQVAYLSVIAAILLYGFVAEGRPAPDPESVSRFRRVYDEFHVVVLHFLLGSLLSVYTIFFFKSSSLFASFGFLGVLVVVLVANESRRVKALGLPVRFMLFSICLLSFSASVVPIAFGSVGVLVFMLSMLAGCIPVAVMYAWIRKRVPERETDARWRILAPFGATLAIFLMLYQFRLIPPVPLSIPFMGVYHNVERSGEHFLLSHERPAWRFWHHGDQYFRAQPGDRVFVYFRIFSPARFADRVTMHWYWKDDARGWALQDAIPINIVGGREEGFRGYGVKSNYQPGRWQVRVETTDGREIGRIYFRIEAAPESPRNFRIETE